MLFDVRLSRVSFRSARSGVFTLGLLGLATFFIHGERPAVHSGGWIRDVPLREARAGASVTMLPGDRILVTGGDGQDGPLNTVEYLGGSARKRLQPMNVARSGHISVTLKNGLVLVAGG